MGPPSRAQISMYYLILFYVAVKHDLGRYDFRTVTKFVCVKSIIFFSFWSVCCPLALVLLVLFFLLVSQCNHPRAAPVGLVVAGKR